MDDRKAPPSIPQPLLSKLLSLRPVLEVKGAFQKRTEKGRNWRSWRLRFRYEDVELGYRKHRSLALGTDEGVARAAWTLVQSWRAERARRKAEVEEAKRRARERARQHGINRKYVRLAAPGGRDVRYRVAQDYDKAAAEGPGQAFMFAARMQHTYPRPRTGRPPKARLW